MRVRLINRSPSHNNLRTDFVEGEALGIPQIGHSFVMFSEPLEHTDLGKAAVRQVVTSLVQSVRRVSGGWEFSTLNSQYEVNLI